MSTNKQLDEFIANLQQTPGISPEFIAGATAGMAEAQRLADDGGEVALTDYAAGVMQTCDHARTLITCTILDLQRWEQLAEKAGTEKLRGIRRVVRPLIESLRQLKETQYGSVLLLEDAANA